MEKAFEARRDPAPPAPPGVDPHEQWGKQAKLPEVTRFLQGPQHRRFELARAIRIFFELMSGFRALHFVGPCVTVFGSARFKEEHPYYHLARAVGRRLAEAGFTVMTGGGPGIMEAANRGAKDMGGVSIGCNIELPKEQRPNAYLDRWVTFRHFYVRKLMLVKYSYAFIAMPGGFGTLDEIMEVATLIQTHKIPAFLDFLRHGLIPQRTIDPSDAERLLITDSPEEAVNLIVNVAQQQFGLTYGPRPKRRWFLWES